METTSESVCIALGDPDAPEAVEVEWPIIRRTDRALCLLTPGGRFWVPKSRWRRLPQAADAAGFRALLEFIEVLASEQDDARVCVSCVGPGSTTLNCRVAFSIQRSNKDAVSGENDDDERRRTAVVGLALLEDEGGQLTTSRLALRSSLRNPSEKVVGGQWAGMAAVRAQLQAAFDAIQAKAVLA